MIEPAHLVEQAERLLAVLPGQERPRLADRCRAVSATYYAVFHAGLKAAADQSVGEDKRGSSLYSLAYRSIDHGKMRSLCVEIKKQNPSQKYSRYWPAGGFDAQITGYADAFIDLYEQRMLADYDPSHVLTVSEVEHFILIAKSALTGLEAASEDSKTAFLTLLLFPPR
ncbi:hypothetical protein [Methylobacterium haplocladii]|uniref:hypothetical protein n=1 Tax=Methylobacterium haplocladii TaxID=1176176 RepID=UPI0011BEF857|nr:hypothetical protein [Methylobacterium haplocladii]